MCMNYELVYLLYVLIDALEECTYRRISVGCGAMDTEAGVSYWLMDEACTASAAAPTGVNVIRKLIQMGVVRRVHDAFVLFSYRQGATWQCLCPSIHKYCFWRTTARWRSASPAAETRGASSEHMHFASNGCWGCWRWCHDADRGRCTSDVSLPDAYTLVLLKLRLQAFIPSVEILRWRRDVGLMLYIAFFTPIT